MAMAHQWLPFSHIRFIPHSRLDCHAAVLVSTAMTPMGIPPKRARPTMTLRPQPAMYSTKLPAWRSDAGRVFSMGSSDSAVWPLMKVPESF